MGSTISDGPANVTRHVLIKYSGRALHGSAAGKHNAKCRVRGKAQRQTRPPDVDDVAMLRNLVGGTAGKKTWVADSNSLHEMVRLQPAPCDHTLRETSVMCTLRGLSLTWPALVSRCLEIFSEFGRVTSNTSPYCSGAERRAWLRRNVSTVMCRSCFGCVVR